MMMMMTLDECSGCPEGCQSYTLALTSGNCMDNFCMQYTTNKTIPKIWNKYSLRRNCAFSAPISTFMCLWALYIFPRSVCLFCCKKICGPILRIYKSLTETWMWKLGLMPRNSFCRNTLMGFPLHFTPRLAVWVHTVYTVVYVLHVIHWTIA